jgi:hypothetical protein
MKQALTKLFKTTNIEPIFVGLGIFLILTFLIFPGLTASDTLINIISALGAVILGLFVFYYLGGDKFKTNETEFCEAGETELDYISQEELKTKTKTKKTVVPKQSVKKKVVSHVVHPKVEKVMGEYQLNNKEKVRKSLIEGKTKSQNKKGDEPTKATPPPKPPKLK